MISSIADFFLRYPQDKSVDFGILIATVVN